MTRCHEEWYVLGCDSDVPKCTHGEAGGMWGLPGTALCDRGQQRKSLLARVRSTAGLGPHAPGARSDETGRQPMVRQIVSGDASRPETRVNGRGYAAPNHIRRGAWISTRHQLLSDWW